MSKSIQDYLDLVTSEYQESPNFLATVSLNVSPFVQLQALFEQMEGPLFDLATPPIGNQLDMIGVIVGVSRIINNPFSDVFFTWDGTQSNGWDFGVWQSADSPSALVSLPDDIYLSLINAKIAANSWDGTTEGAYAIFAILFPDYVIMYQDYQNMTFAVALQGMVPDSVTLALLTGNYLALRPEGVEIVEYFVPVDTNPLFAWDAESPSLAGWDTGSWAKEVSPT